MKAKILFCIIFAVAFVNARVLKLSDEKFSSYFSVETGTSVLKTSPFDENMATVDSYSHKYRTGMGGEFGFVYSSPYIGWRFSFEVLKPSKLKGVDALAGTTVQYTVDSDVTAVAPKLGLEIHLTRNPNFRFYLFGYYGSSNLQMTNTYSSASSPAGDHTVTAKSSSAVMGGGVGFETSFVDTTTFIIEIGHRVLKFNEIKYAQDVVTFQGAKSAGDVMTNVDGSDRSLNFSGYIVSIGFRFWL